jgi:hypothetical protein
MYWCHLAALQAALEVRIEEALGCACVSALKEGPCGVTFVNAFTCYHRSTAMPKGCDCLDAHIAFAVGVCCRARVGFAYAGGSE